MTFFGGFQKRRRQQLALTEELGSHLDELIDELVSSGISLEEARYEARRQFGNRTQLLEESRAVWRFKWLDALLRDVRFSWRLAKRQPWTMAAAILSIAIGVGANTAVTSVVDRLLLNPLGIRQSDLIVAATVHLTKLQMIDSETSGAEFQDLQSLTGVFSSMAATEGREWTVGGEQPARLIGVAVTPKFFDVFEQRLSLGHVFDGSNEQDIVLSDGLWQVRFGRNPSVIGSKLLLDGKAYRVVGVGPPDFHFPARAEAWVPLTMKGRFERGNNMSLSLFARLNDGVSREQAQQGIDVHLKNLAASPDGIEMNKLGYGIDLRPLANFIAGDLRLPLSLLWSAAFVLLITACANVAGLLLARSGSRRKEIAIRVSVGASRFQILRQLFTESVILALLGGGAGLALAAVLLDVLKRAPLPFQHLLRFTGLDRRMLLYGMALALVSSVVFGIVPAIELIREQHYGGLARSQRRWFQSVYIVGQVSAAMLLLVITGLLVKSMRAVEMLQPGFDSRNVTTAFLIKPPAKQTAFYGQVLSRLRSSPGVQSAALAYALPFGGGDAPTSLFDIKSHHHQDGEPTWHGEAFQVSPGYFETLRIPLLRGRLILDSDKADAVKVCVIDATLASRFFANEDPIGQEIAMYSGWARIVGVVAAVRDQSLERFSRPAVYYSLAQIPYFPQIGLVVRSSAPAASLIRDAVAHANPNVPVFDIKMMDERIGASFSMRLVMAMLVTLFASISILLAALGIHGVIAQVVSERTPEIGIRMALGARSRDIFQHYAAQGLQLSLLGIVIGLGAAIGCSGWLRGFLYQVQPLDPATIFLGVVGVLLMTGIALLAPCWHASHIDPQMALRAE